MHGLVRCKHERRCSRARGEESSFKDVKIKPQIEKWTTGCGWRHAPEAWVEDLGDLRISSELSSCLRTRGSRFRAGWGQTNLCATGDARWLG